jgi:hypothetical protein
MGHVKRETADGMKSSVMSCWNNEMTICDGKTHNVIAGFNKLTSAPNIPSPYNKIPAHEVKIEELRATAAKHRICHQKFREIHGQHRMGSRQGG